MKNVIITKLRHAVSTFLILQNFHISYYAAFIQMLWLENSGWDSKCSDENVSKNDSNNRNNVNYENDTFVCMRFFYKYKSKFSIARFLFQCSFYLKFAVKLFVILSFLCYLLRVLRIYCKFCQTMMILLRLLKTLTQQCWEMLVSVSEFLFNINNLSVVSDDAIENYSLFDLLDILLKNLVNFLKSLKTLLFLRSANMLFFSFLETKYDLWLEFYEKCIFKSLNIHVFLSHIKECKNLLIKCDNKIKTFMKLSVQKNLFLKRTVSNKRLLISKTCYCYCFFSDWQILYFWYDDQKSLLSSDQSHIDVNIIENCYLLLNLFHFQ